MIKTGCWLLLGLWLSLSFAQNSERSNPAKLRILAWKQLIKTHKTTNTLDLLKEVNDFFNHLKYLPETALESTAEVWQTPLEFLTSGEGDCEDYAIAKYFTLAAMGIPEKKLHITYVVIKNTSQAHMVLTYYQEPDADPLVLDNLQKDIVPASQRLDLVPVYSFNAKDVWLVDRIGKARPYSKAKSLSKWQRLLQRLKLPEESK